MSFYAPDDAPEPALTDFGYTAVEPDADFDALAIDAAFASPDEPMMLAETIGLSDVDVVAIAERDPAADRLPVRARAFPIRVASA